MEEKRKKRSEIDKKYKWDLSRFYKNVDEWYNDIKKTNILIEDIKKYQGNIMDSSTNLLYVLKKSEELNRLCANLYVYAHMRYHEDTTEDEALTNKGKIQKLYTEIGEQLFFINPEILKSHYSLIEKYMDESDDLKMYQFFFEDLFRQKEHTLSDPEEKMLAGIKEILNSSDEIYTTICNSDLKYGIMNIDGKKIEITDSNYVKLLGSDNQKIRKKVFKRYYKIHDDLKNTFASTFRNSVKSESFISKVRKYDNPLQMNLYADNIDTEVYNNLITTVNNNLGAMHKYIKLRKKELKLKSLHMYDIYAKMVSDDKKEYAFEEACDIVKKALSPLGVDYITLLDKAFNEHWIDVFDNIGKKNGAYSWGTYDSNPYILMSYNNNLDSIFTLAHELGHSMHTYHTVKKQPYIYYNYSIFTAEIASTVNEILLNKYLLSNTNDVKEKKILLNSLMEKFKGTLYRQTMFAEFEKIIFKKEQNNEVLTEKLISDTYYNLNKKYYGKNIIHDEEIRLEWSRIPHFYRPFYVYQYSTGIVAACAIASDILNGNKEVLEKYKEFLASGGSDYPINLLKNVGVDMTTTEPIEKAIKLFEEAIDEYIALD